MGIGGPHQNTGITLVCKTRMVWLYPMVKKCDYMFSRYNIIPAYDGRTDGHRATACMASRGKNCHAFIYYMYSGILVSTQGLTVIFSVMSL